ncbi:hypothetical protein BDV23DRAFT_152562 [Aspergillus alliaceus]|uniref:Glycine zipper 2TM domain-containing protein n=1 Tax=Petromyces alliaceus TaxID=209559 RepID=A0A5N7CCF6_PETAA|nr:hypothetical protein BDV23DRAFT_152562 [Aspergillus alliaceus]
MSDPYTQHPHYTSPVPGADASVYTPADSSYQNPPYDYDPQHPYGQQYPLSQNYQYVSHYDLTQTPKSHPPQASGPDLSPTAEFQQVGRQQGSNADYYNISASEHDQYYTPNSQTQEPASTSNEEGDERSLAGTLVGGAGGYYLGHQAEHGLLGAVGGAILGNLIGDKMEDKTEDDNHDHHHGRHHRHKHRHSHHGHRHHSHSHSHSHHRHHRSHSRHGSHSGSY